MTLNNKIDQIIELLNKAKDLPGDFPYPPKVLTLTDFNCIINEIQDLKTARIMID